MPTPPARLPSKFTGGCGFGHPLRTIGVYVRVNTKTQGVLAACLGRGVGSPPSLSADFGQSACSVPQSHHLQKEI